MTPGATRHRRLLRAQARVWAVLAAAIFVVGAGSAFFQFIRTDNYELEMEAAGKRAHFWRVVAGEAAAPAPTVENRLARDLGAQLGPIDPAARSLPPAIEAFRGDTDAYGGITAALGFDPFDQTGLTCRECGPLDAETKAKLLRIKRGAVEYVIAEEAPDPPEGIIYVPFGIPLALVLLVLWLAGGALALRVAQRHALGRSKASRLDWSLSGPDRAQQYGSLALSPLPVAFYVFFCLRQNRKIDEEMRARFPSELQRIDQFDRIVAGLSEEEASSPAVVRAIEQRDKVLADLRRFVATQDGADRSHLDELQHLLGYAEQTVKSREQALAKFDSWH